LCPNFIGGEYMSEKKRLIIKLSGEALSGKSDKGIDPLRVKEIALEIKDAYDLGLFEIGVIIGGGNIWRGKTASEMGMERSSADYMGMIATIMNALALQNALETLGVETRTMTSLNIPQVAEPYIRRKAISNLEKGMIVIFGGGTGNPYFSTDTTSALRAAEIGARTILMAKNGTDGVYDKDPRFHNDAVKYTTLTHHEVLENGLQVMDSTAAALCKDNDIEIVVFDMNIKGNIKRAALGENIGTVIK
jgi:uridylate kinase